MSKSARKVSQVKEPLFHFLALASVLARSKPQVPFLGISLLRNQTETLATQARLTAPESPRMDRSRYTKTDK